MSLTTGARATDGRAAQTAEQVLDRVARTARPDVVFGQPVERGDVTLIPCCEVAMGMGMCSGSGTNPTPARSGMASDQGTGMGSGEGMGAGGGARGRPVAVIVITQGTVRVEPILDVTKVALAALTTAGFMAFWVARLVGATRAPLPRPAPPPRSPRAQWPRRRMNRP
jgi:uncharacterized spore protein YtfJ